MSKEIKKSEIAEKNVYANIINGARIALEQAEKLNEELRKTARLSNAALAKSSKIGNAAEIREVEKQMKIANATKLQALKLDVEKIKINAQKVNAERQYKSAIDKAAAAQAKQTQKTKDQTDAYKRLAKTQRDVKNESKRLGAELLELGQKTGKSTIEYRNLAAEYRRVTRSAKKFDRQLKKLDSRVGDNFRNVGNYRKAIGGLNRVMGRLGIAFGISTIVRGTINTIKDFDQSMQTLKAITQEETTELRALAKELGESTVFTANEAADAMTKLAMAGFNTNQILKATPAVLSLAAAGQIELAESADIASNVLSGFGLNAEDLDRVVDVIAKTATSTNTTIQTLGESFKEIAPTANNLKIPIEEVAAAVGLLGNSGIKGTDATTTLNTALNRLAKPTREMSDKMKELNVEFFDSNGQFIGITETIKVLNKSMEGLTDEQRANAVSTIFGAKANKQMTSLLLGQTTAMINGTEQTLKGADALAFLTKEYENAGGAAKAMADEQIDSVEGAWAKLKSAVQGFILNLSDSTGFADKLKTSLVFLAENLGTIIKFILKASAAFVTYKVVMASLKLADNIRNFRTLGTTISSTGVATQEATLKAKGFGQAMKGIGFTLLIGLAIELAMSFWDIASGAKQAREDVARLQHQLQKGSDRARERVAQREKELQQNKDLAKDEKERAILQAKAITATERDIDLVSRRRGETQRTLLLLKDLDKQRRSAVGGWAAYAEDLNTALNETVSFGKSTDTLTDRIAQLTADVEGQNAAIKIYEGSLSDMGHEQKIATKNTKENTGATDGNTGSLNKNNKELKRKIANLDELLAIEKEIAEEEKEEADRLARELELGDAVTEAKKSAILSQMSEEEREIQEVKDNFKRRMDLVEEFGRGREELEAQMNNEINEIRTKYVKDEEEAEKERLEKLAQIDADAAKKRSENQKEWIDITADYFIKRSEEKIAQIDKEIAAAEKQFDLLQELAKNGNIAAGQSLKEQQRLIIEANEKKLAEQKRIERIKLAETALTVYAGKVEANDETPLISTITDMTLLRAFIESLPSFDVGADRLDSKGKNIDGKGGFLAINHPDEQILTAEQNQRTGFMPAEQKTKLVESYLNGSIVNLKSEGATQIGNGWDIMPLVSKLDNIEKAINNIESSSVDVQGLTDAMLTISSRVKKGNRTVTDTLKFRHD